MADRIVLNIPHSSFQFPFGYDAWDNGIHIDMERLTDIFTDKLFIPDTSQPEIIPVIFPYSRFFCDAERLVDDPMEKIGQGIIKMISHPGNLLQKKVLFKRNTKREFSNTI